ncbi:methyltransferase family protein [Candidatus Manganitrophus noduliformans]|uniref:Isoprenylcysteine carboxylmethyltransferase family protein n=1 Tax=Candidatus Manganitrophus noduliformans TaxID=2606439 RepID=A0A7X6IDA2_9BACT|nr:isoprenylcysteine carboxylmethyltransferase family protein [Candidatus Manganitrophus noduliformans]NKE73523.1 isoprenylcysteine carboxylmethyltransferase family protein [Candidatus Manganitrophus noduliformans]
MDRVTDSLAFNRRGIIGLLLLLPISAVLSFSKPLIVEDSFLDLAMDGLAWILFYIYVTFRLWATLYVGGRKNIELQTEGPYSITRNPLYLGSLCFALSMACFLKSVSLLLTILLIWIFYSKGVINAEEEYLARKFPEIFNRYRQETPRLLPIPSRYRNGSSIKVDLNALKFEAKRLWAAGLLPISAELLMHLRMAPWWPHWFWLP